MQENACSEFVDLIREASRSSDPVEPIHLRRGKVLSAEPLRLDVAGTIQEGDRVFISHRLVDGHKELLRLDCSGVSAGFALTAECPLSGHSGSAANAAEGTLSTPRCTATQAEPVLKPGDEVLLLTEDDQIFFLIDKVVKAG